MWYWVEWGGWVIFGNIGFRWWSELETIEEKIKGQSNKYQKANEAP